MYPTTTGFDLAGFEALVKQNGGSAMAEKLGFDPTNVAQVGDQAPTLITKLKSSGVTSVVLFADNALVTPLTKAATDQEYSPEWIFTGYGYQDFDGFARTFDQDQMRHAFGLSVLSPYVASTPPYLDLFTWYWGETQGNTWSITNGLFNAVYTYIQYAGPTLTAQNVKKNSSPYRLSGGAATERSPSNRVRQDLHLPFNEYSLFGTTALSCGGTPTSPRAHRPSTSSARARSCTSTAEAPRLCQLLQVRAEVLPRRRAVAEAASPRVPRRRRLPSIAMRFMPLSTGTA